MRILSTPARLRWATALLLVCIPLAGAQAVIAAHAPWWRLPWGAIRVWSLVAALVFVPLAVWITQGRVWAMALTTFTAGVWVTVSFAIASMEGHFWLALYSMGVGAFWALCLSWLRTEAGRSFLSANVRWYQGRPKAIPGVLAEVRWSEGAEPKTWPVARLDRDGVFLDTPIPDAPRDSLWELTLMRGDTKAQARGRWISTLDDGSCAGLRFEAMNPDQRKELGDFIERLKGEGHEIST